VIAHLRGRVLRSTAETVVLDVGGVGYELTLTAASRERVSAPGGEVELWVHTHVREDQIALFGFASAEELEMFRLLIQVDGVGPKVGQAILSSAHLDLLKRAILSEDVGPIRRASGVGLRTAQKVIIDLKPKLEADATMAPLPRVTAAADGDLARRVEQTLRGLGFSATEARAGVDSVEWAAGPNAEEALAQALKALARR